MKKTFDFKRALALVLAVIMAVAVMSVAVSALEPQDKPVGLEAEAETFAGKEDGRIIGLKTTMEYSYNGTDFKKVTDRYMTFAPGTVYVRYAETSTKAASEAVALYIEEGDNAVITFVADGVVVAKVEQLYGWALEVPAIPAKEGYTKVAPKWSVTNFDTVQGDMTVEAIYTADIYNVTYVVDGATVSTVSVTYGSDATAPELPAKDGFTAAWDKDGKAIKADTTITAVYTAVETEAPATEAPATEAPVIDIVEEPASCGAAVSFAGVALVASLGLATTFVSKKKED